MIDRYVGTRGVAAVVVAVSLVLAAGGLAGRPALADPAATKAPLPVGNQQLCLRCHDDLNVVLGGAHVHAPVAADTCTGCHNPHAARHGKLLREAGRELCFTCHADTAAEVRSPVLHGALRSESACLSCHEAHASEHADLLRDREAAVCVTCHDPIRARLGLKSPHAPAAAGDCSGCHEPHAGAAAGLLDRPVPELCFTCHANGPELRRSHAGFDLGGADCRSCHEPHGTDAAHLVRDAVHAVFEPGSCDTCHASSTDATRLASAQPGLCTTCHDQWDGAPAAAQHPVGGGTACTSCHSPHAGEAPGMLRGAERSLCLGCHGDVRTAIDRATSFHPLEAADGRCTACHGLHDAAAAPLLARAPEKLCGDCHTDHARFAHPMGPNVADPTRKGKSLDCLSCHTPHASDHKMLLLASPDRDLCVRCHQALH